MELMNQPLTGQLGNRLIELLNSEEFHTLNIIVAFAKNSGVLRIKDALKKFRDRGGKVNVYVGVDMGGTSYEALTALRLHTDSLNVVHSESSQTFHPKIYHLLGLEKELAIVGSHNLTGGGLWTNFESSAFISSNSSNSDEIQIFKTLSDYISKLSSLDGSIMAISAQDDIDKLLRNGYVVKEVWEQIRLAKTNKQGGSRESLFGKGVQAKSPRISKPNEGKVKPATAPPAKPSLLSKPIAMPHSQEGRTIWFETRKLTGGSRNILDLSMKSLIESGDPTGTEFDIGEEKFMRGGVGFFGINPETTEYSKNINLNFEGIDYKDNTIKFPDGPNNNGTWRLQIKGISSDGRKITDSLKAKGDGYHLVEKIVSFTKVADDYYFMSVFSEIELENFKLASGILARNGSSKQAKLLGVL